MYSAVDAAYVIKEISTRKVWCQTAGTEKFSKLKELWRFSHKVLREGAVLVIDWLDYLLRNLYLLTWYAV